MNRKIKIKSFPRIHLTLIGMNSDGYRINGGIGFSISDPTVNCRFQASNKIEIVDERRLKFTENENNRLQNVLNETIKKLKLTRAINCNISGNALPHYGLGSSTAIYMSCIEALLLCNDVQYDFNTIIRLSTRGGTSGIGINTYFEGGFIFDIGIKNKSQFFSPSSIADRSGLLPLVLSQCKSPEWKIGVCIPNYIPNKSEQEEIDFFNSNCPINKSSIDKILNEAVFGITSAMMESDYSVFCKSVNEIQNTLWKYLERSIYGSKLVELERTIRNLGADCVGMSSFGPTLFFLGENIEFIISQLSTNFPNTACYITSFNNHGREINYD